MEILKKLFNFSDTIDGTTFVLRWLLATVIQFPGGYLTGLGLASGNMGVATLGLMVASVGIFLQFSTLLKRSRALFQPAMNAFIFYVSYVCVSIFRGFAEGFGEEVLIFTSLVMLVMFGIAIFKNSGIPKVDHVG